MGQWITENTNITERNQKTWHLSSHVKQLHAVLDTHGNIKIWILFYFLPSIGVGQQTMVSFQCLLGGQGGAAGLLLGSILQRRISCLMWRAISCSCISMNKYRSTRFIYLNISRNERLHLWEKKVVWKSHCETWKVSLFEAGSLFSRASPQPTRLVET